MPHTEGPWEVGGIDRATQGEVIQTPNYWIASVHDLPRHDQNEERKANARLLAAAPDLLAACEEAFDYLQNMPGPADRLRAAIAKAKGA